MSDYSDKCKTCVCRIVCKEDVSTDDFACEIAHEALEAKFKSDNTASLKLPPFKEVWNKYTEYLMNRVRKRPEAGSVQAAEFVYKFIVRQLQA